MEESKKVFRRIKEGKKIGGICTGVAQYTNTDIGMIRVAFLVGLICIPHFTLLYLLTMLVIPYSEEIN